VHCGLDLTRVPNGSQLPDPPQLPWTKGCITGRDHSARAGCFQPRSLNEYLTNQPTNQSHQPANHPAIQPTNMSVRQKPLMSRRSEASYGDIHHFPSLSPPYFNAAPSHDMFVYTSGRRGRQGTKNETRPSRRLKSQATVKIVKMSPNQKSRLGSFVFFSGLGLGHWVERVQLPQS
jgi:hypothetical protein